MTDREDHINLGKIVFDDNNQERSLGPVWQTCSRSLIVFLSQLFVFLLIIFGSFGEITSQKLVTNELFAFEIWAARQDTFYPHQGYEQVKFYKKSSAYFIDWSIRNWKIAACLQLVENWNISNKV